MLGALSRHTHCTGNHSCVVAIYGEELAMASDSVGRAVFCVVLSDVLDAWALSGEDSGPCQQRSWLILQLHGSRSLHDLCQGPLATQWPFCHEVNWPSPKLLRLHPSVFVVGEVRCLECLVFLCSC